MFSYSLIPLLPHLHFWRLLREIIRGINRTMKRAFVFLNKAIVVRPTSQNTHPPDFTAHVHVQTTVYIILELPFCKPGNGWSSKFFLLNHMDYVSLNWNPWDDNAPSLGNSWEPRKSKMAAVIVVNLSSGTHNLYDPAKKPRPTISRFPTVQYRVATRL